MIQYDPTGIFEQNPSKGGVCTILNYADKAIPAGTYTAFGAIASKRFRMTSGIFCVDGAATSNMWLDSNGVRKLALNAPANTIQPINLPFNPAGWCESETGFSLTIACGVIFTASIQGFYYTP